MKKRYTFVTTYIVRADDEAAADKVSQKIHVQIRLDDSVVEFWTNLTDVEDDYCGATYCDGNCPCGGEEW